MDAALDPIRKAVLSELGRMGGHARSASLTAKRRLEIAVKASMAAKRARKRRSRKGKRRGVKA